MQALGRLYMEHGMIRQYLENLAFALERLERGEQPAKEFFEQTVLFAREFVDQYHHFKEEHQMFTRLAEKLGGALDAPIDALRQQHEHGRQYVNSMAEALEGYGEGDDDKVSAVIENLAAFISMLRRHIHQEDHVFFPLVREKLEDSELMVLMAEFEKADRKAGASFLDRSRDRIMKMEALLVKA